MIHTDQTGRSINIPGIPKRIISLVPSQTELLHYLGLTDQVTGITKFCVHPEHWFRSKTRVGGTKSLNFKAIDELQPDLIIGNKEENTKADIELLSATYPVWLSDVNSLEDALRMIRSLGDITAQTLRANSLINDIGALFSQLQPINPPKRVTYLIWQNPLIAVAANTFINSMLEHCGFTNVFHHASRYPETTIEEIVALDCDLLLLSTEPFPFTNKHVVEMQQQLPAAKVLLVDGEMFSWYGSRLLQSAAYFQMLITSLAAPAPFPNFE